MIQKYLLSTDSLKSYLRHTTVWLILFGLFSLFHMPWMVRLGVACIVVFTSLLCKIEDIMLFYSEKMKDYYCGMIWGSTGMLWVMVMGMIAYFHPTGWGWHLLYVLLTPIVIILVEVFANAISTQFGDNYGLE